VVPRPRWLLNGAVSLVYMFVLFPILTIVAVAFDPASQYTFPPSGLSLTWFHSCFSTAMYVQPFLDVSLPVGLIVAVAATIVGTSAALALTRGRLRGSATLEVFFFAPLLVPELLLAVAWFILASRLKIPNSIFNIAAAHVVIATPFVIRSVLAGIIGVDRRLEDAAASLGAGPFQTFRLVTLPLIWSSVLSGMVFAFIISFGDINISLFVAGPGVTTLPVQIFTQIQFQDDPTVAAASTLQILLIAVLLLGANWLRRRR
jgi:putative spermidine/putrescine transport system permease protein